MAIQEVTAAITACSYVVTSADAATMTLASFPSAVAPVAVASTEAAATTLRVLRRNQISATLVIGASLLTGDVAHRASISLHAAQVSRQMWPYQVVYATC